MNWPLYRSMHTRGLTQAKLAALTGVNRSVLARILTNEPGRGKETRPKLFPHLIATEILLLGWGDEYATWLVVTNQPAEKKDAWQIALWVQEKTAALKTDIETSMLGVEQTSTGNNVPNAETP